jgi:thiamine biosynthesis lipoprotein
MFNPNSTISKINANTPVEPNHYLTELYICSKQIHNESNGYFDPTVAPLVNAWGFGTTHEDTPDSARIDSIRQFVGFHKTSIDSTGKISKLDPRTIIDFSSIAKGYACDEIGRLFKRHKINNFMIEIGGEICVSGKNQYGKNWHISIDMPIEQSDTVIHSSALILSVTDKGIATSGNYRNFHIIDGKKVSHIINPLTGYSEQSDVLSATIIAPTAAQADAYATACIAMGFENCSKMINANNNIEAMIIYSDNEGNTIKWFSKHLDKYIVNEAK